MSTEASKPSRRAAGVLTIGIGAAFLSATGQPTPKMLARLAEWGVPDLAARIAIHAGACSIISTTAAEQMLRAQGHIECPASGQIYSMAELKRCYVS